MNPGFLFSFLTVTAVICHAAGSNSTLGGDTTAFTYLGTIEGKSYYFDSSQSLAWDEYRLACGRANMNPASVDTADELNFLRNAFVALGSRGNCWTGGRDAFLSRQFTWDRSDASETEVRMPVYHNANPNYLNCLTLEWNVVFNAWIIPCFQKRTVLCETKG